MNIHTVNGLDSYIDFQSLRLEFEPQSITNSIDVAAIKKLMELTTFFYAGPSTRNSEVKLNFNLSYKIANGLSTW